VLLSVPVDVLVRRLRTRTTNHYGKTAEERALILSQVEVVEPLLRATCTHELDATQPIDLVVEQLAKIGDQRTGS
jgi:gluconate kinase